MRLWLLFIFIVLKFLLPMRIGFVNQVNNTAEHALYIFVSFCWDRVVSEFMLLHDVIQFLLIEMTTNIGRVTSLGPICCPPVWISLFSSYYPERVRSIGWCSRGRMGLPISTIATWDIEYKDCADRVLQVRGDQTAESLLPGGVPELQPARRWFICDILAHEIDADGGLV